MSDLPVPIRKYRREVPEAHRTTLDTRLRWLWNQRFGTVQTIWKHSPDALDHTACTLILQAILAKDLDCIAMIFHRLEGGAQVDTEIHDEQQTEMRL